MKQNKLFIVIGVLAVLLVASVIWAVTSSTGSTAQAIGIEEAKAQAETFINENLMVDGQTVNVNSIVEENGLYKMAIDIGQGDIVTSYLSLDGKTFFPQGLDMPGAETNNTASNNTDSANNSAPVVPANVVKSERPNVELFVMSHCPYGTQMEKGILPVANLLEDKIDFEIKFVDYAMHGEKELVEQMNQYCINQEEPDKFNDYLSCFLEEGNGSSCLAEANVNTSAMDSCVDNVDKEYKIIENFENNVNYKGSYPEFAIHKAENEEYGVSGSPTLVINGSKVSSGRDSATLLATVCAAFEGEAPSECDTELSNSAPSPGFGYNTAGSNATAAATCN